MKNIILNNGVEVPCVGLGTYPMNGEILFDAIFNSVKLGYRSFDTATAYKNEEVIGHVLQKITRQEIDRERLFITTKVSNKWQRDGDIRKTLNASLERLMLEYIDLYLMHWPNPETYIDTWGKMEELYIEGKVKAIGVCNFHEHHLEQLLKHARVVPAVNQIELHPLLNQEKLVAYCTQKGIKIVCYSPLARMDKKLINNMTLNHIAEKYNKSVPQIVLKWGIQHGYAVIPKTERLHFLKQNIEIFNFNLEEDEIKEIDNINEDYRVRHNPDNCDFSKL